MDSQLVKMLLSIRVIIITKEYLRFDNEVLLVELTFGYGWEPGGRWTVVSRTSLIENSEKLLKVGGVVVTYPLYSVKGAVIQFVNINSD